MLTGRRNGVVAALGVLVVIVGALVLRSPGATADVGWFSYDGPPSPELLNGLVAWNLTRTVGATLVLLGLVVLAHLLGRAATGRSAGGAARFARPALALAGVLVIGGLVAFFVSGTAAQLGMESSAWTRDQTEAALVAATGLVVGAVGTGLRRRNAP